MRRRAEGLPGAPSSFVGVKDDIRSTKSSVRGYMGQRQTSRANTVGGGRRLEVGIGAS